MREHKILTAEEEVEQFLESVLPADASAVQTIETRKAFIAGMQMFYMHTMQLSNRDDEFEDEFNRYVEDLDGLTKKYMLQK
jgi:hypothetical protein